jgi:hypothetical protein
MATRPPRQWLLIGVVCGLAAVLVVRAALALLVGSVKLVAVVGALALVWLFLRGPRDGEG